MELIMSALFIITVVVAAIDVISGALTVDKKVLWILMILFVPLIGVVMYYLLGRPERRSA
jgi:hypothetical protein